MSKNANHCLTNSIRRGVSIVADRALAALVNNFRTKIIGAIVAGVLAPQAVFAGCHKGGHFGSRPAAAYALKKSPARTNVVAQPASSATPSVAPVAAKPSFVNQYFANQTTTAAVAPSAPLESESIATPASQATYPATTVATSVEATVVPASAKPAVVQATTADTATGSADLVLEDVELVERGTLTTGPVFRVKFRNQGSLAAGGFRVGAFAESGGELNDDAAQAVAQVAKLAAGASGQVTLRLPVPVVRLVSTSSDALAYDQLLVVVDLDDTVVESQKSNNIANVNRDDLEPSAR